MRVRYEALGGPVEPSDRQLCAPYPPVARVRFLAIRRIGPEPHLMLPKSMAELSDQ
jgi:hypothetical protein